MTNEEIVSYEIEQPFEIVGGSDYLAYDGNIMKNAFAKCIDFYISTLKGEPEICKLMEEYKAINQIPLTEDNLYFAEKNLLNEFIPKLANYSEKASARFEETKNYVISNLENKDIDDDLDSAENARYINMLELSNDCAILSWFLLYSIAKSGTECSNYDNWHTYNPNFTHLPFYGDISKTLAGNTVYLALANIARLYATEIFLSIFYMNDSFSTVRLWTNNGESFKPIAVKVNKDEILKNRIQENDNKAIWPLLIAEAVKNSEINTDSVGKIIEGIFGEKFECHSFYEMVLVARDNAEATELLFDSIESWIDDGFPVSIMIASGGTIPRGYYNIFGTYTVNKDGNDQRYLRINDLKSTVDVAIEDVLGDILALDVNMSEELRNTVHIRNIDFDIIEDYKKEDLISHKITNKMYQSYMKVACSLYESFASTFIVKKDIEQPALIAYNYLGNLVGMLSRSFGCEDKLIENSLPYLAAYLENYITAPNSIKIGNTRKAIYKALIYLNEIFHYSDERHFDPLREFQMRFSHNFSEYWFFKHNMSVDSDTIEYKTNELMEDKRFKDIVKNIPAVSLFAPSKKLLDKIIEQYDK